jgi:aminoglycoside phosphotransferase (APT) family kinase protein
MSATSLDDRLRRYLTEALDAPIARVGPARRLLGGSTRDIWEVHAEWGAREGDLTSRDLVVRLDPEASLLEGNRAVEYAMHQGFAAVPGVPVAEPLLIEDDPAPLGRPFYVMSKVTGTSSAATLLSPGYTAVRPMIFGQIMEILAAISVADYRELGLGRMLAGHPPAESWRIELLSRNYWPDRDSQPVSGILTRAEAIACWEKASGLRADPVALRWWQLFTHVKATAIWVTGGHQVMTGRSRELKFALAHWSVDRQEKWMIEDMEAAS